MENEKKVDGTSRRKFIKIAAATAYVAPLIASMPAHATYKSSGSAPVRQSPKPVRRRRRVFRKPVYRKYNRYSRYNRRW